MAEIILRRADANSVLEERRANGYKDFVTLDSPTYGKVAAPKAKPQIPPRPSAADVRPAPVSGSRNEKYVLVDGKYRLNPAYDPPFDITLGEAIAIPPLIGAAVALLPEIGPAGALFGRGRLRNGDPSLFNWGDPRIGWSWDAEGWLGARNYFGPHGGKPRTDSHWHRTYIPGPKGPK